MGVGGPWPPQGSRGWSLLGVIASRGAVMPNASEERSEGGLCSPNPPLLWRGGRNKQQQKHRPLGDDGLHSLPSLRSGFCPSAPALPRVSPAAPYGFRKAPYTLGGHVMACKGQHCAQNLGTHIPSFQHPLEERGRGGHRARSQELMVSGPSPEQQAVALPRPQLCPVRADPHAGWDLPAPPPVPTPCLSPSWPQASPRRACAWAPCPPASPRRNGPALCPPSGGGAAA